MRAKLEITNNVHEYAACCANRLGCNWLANIDFCNVISLNKEEFAHRFRTFHLIQYLNVYCLETVINLKNPGLNYCLALTIQLYNAVYCMKLENKRDFTIGFNLIVPKIIHKFLQQSPVFISTSSGQKKRT